MALYLGNALNSQRPIPRFHNPTDVIHTCACCKRELTGPEWAALEAVVSNDGYNPLRDGVDYRRCKCGNLLAELTRPLVR